MLVWTRTVPYDESRDMKNRISIDPQVHFGKPCVAGTRIPVHCVLELIREGINFEIIVRDYFPDISEADVRACMQSSTDS